MNKLMFSLEDILAIVTAMVAVAGLILSIYNFYIRRQDKKPRLVAEISNGFLTFGPELSETMLIFEIANPGEIPVKISTVEIAWKKKSLVFIGGIEGTRKFPFELEAGDSAKFWIPIKRVASSLKEEQGCIGSENIRAKFKSAVGNEYLSKKIKFNVDGWT